MRALLTATCLAVFLMVPATVVRTDDADKYADTIKLFQNAGESAGLFKKSHGYAVFPSIGKAGLGIGGAHGQGRDFVAGKAVGKTKMTQLSIGWQAGAGAGTTGAGAKFIYEPL